MLNKTNLYARCKSKTKNVMKEKWSKIDIKKLFKRFICYYIYTLYIYTH